MTYELPTVEQARRVAIAYALVDAECEVITADERRRDAIERAHGGVAGDIDDADYWERELKVRRAIVNRLRVLRDEEGAMG